MDFRPLPVDGRRWDLSPGLSGLKAGEYIFSSIEEVINDLLSLEESIKGLDVEVFGTPIISRI